MRLSTGRRRIAAGFSFDAGIRTPLIIKCLTVRVSCYLESCMDWRTHDIDALLQSPPPAPRSWVPCAEYRQAADCLSGLPRKHSHRWIRRPVQSYRSRCSPTTGSRLNGFCDSFDLSRSTLAVSALIAEQTSGCQYHHYHHRSSCSHEHSFRRAEPSVIIEPLAPAR